MEDRQIYLEAKDYPIKNVLLFSQKRQGLFIQTSKQLFEGPSIVRHPSCS